MYLKEIHIFIEEYGEKKRKLRHIIVCQLQMSTCFNLVKRYIQSIKSN